MIHSSKLDRRSFLGISAAGSALLATGPLSNHIVQAATLDKPEQLPSEQERRKLVVTSYRVVESGFHNAPTVPLDRFDPDWYMENVRKAHTQVVIIQTKSHWGYAYYDTKVGIRHPTLNFDLIARMVEAGHRNGLAVVAYYSGQVDTQSGLRYPDWMGRNPDGSLSWVGRHFAWCCHHSPYHDYALGMYREIFSQYDFDGLFVDGLPWPRWVPEHLCYCSWCMARYEKDDGESFLAGIDEPEGYGKRLEWLQESSGQYVDEILQVVHSLRPGLPIWFNQTSPDEMPTKILRKASCLFQEGHEADTPSGLSASALVLRDWEMPGPQVLIYWGGYDGAPEELEKFRTAAILVQGARPRFVTDQQNMPDGRQRPEFFEWAGRLQEYTRQVEPLIQNLKPITSLGVFFSEATRDHLAAQRRPSSLGLGDFRESIGGCLEIFGRTNYPVGVIPPWQLSPDALGQYDLIALPETDALSEAEGQALRDFVKKGGKLLASWKPGLVDELGKERANFLLADVLGVNYVEEVKKYAGKDGPGIYLQSTGHPLSAFLGSGEVGILAASGSRDPAFCPFVHVQGPAENLLDYRLPYVVPDLDKHILDSWNVAPPGNDKLPQAATIQTYGQGKAVYIGVPIFQRSQPALNFTLSLAPLYWADEFIRGLVRQLVPDPAIRVHSVGGTQAAFYRQGSNQVVVQLLNSGIWANRGPAPPIRDIETVGRSDRFPIRTARLAWPKEQALSVTKGPSWRVQVPEVAIHAIVVIDIG